MKAIQHLFKNNRSWAERISSQDPSFFEKLSSQQLPAYLWIGCSDSRVPANQIVGLLPGELFVHRNIANLVIHSDLNCLSVIQFAVDVLKVKHIIVCGHYSCSGVRAVFQEDRIGLSDNWLAHIKDLKVKYSALLDGLDHDTKLRRLCELNVVEQVKNVSQTTVCLDAWERGQGLAVHGWIYDINDGLLRDLNISLTRHHEVEETFAAAVEKINRHPQ
jgi:carbonic anhydrase